MEILEAIQLKAINDVVTSDHDYVIRKILRWYSTTFHTPLHIVETLPLEYVLQHFFEVGCESMTKAERNKKIQEVIESKEERLAREKAESGMSDDEFMKLIKKREKAAKKKRKAKELEQAKQRAKDGDMDFLSPEKVSKEVQKALSNVPTVNVDELPDISMAFDSNLDDKDALGS